jgi:hypothetical protein
VQRLVGGGQQVGGVGEQRGAGPGQLDPSRAAHEQRPADLALERADLGAQRRLGQAQPRGRSREMELLGDRDEVAELTEVHRPQ